MAVRHEELIAGGEAVVLDFPRSPARARADESRRIRARRGALRLTARGWATAVSAVVVVAVALAGVAAAGSNGGRLSTSTTPKALVVAPGETLWDIASTHAAPGVDIRAYVDALVALNHLDGSVEAAERLRLPR